MPVKKKLKPKQERFCQEFTVDCNAAQAAIRAGYSKKTAKEQASRLLTNVNLSIRINDLLNKKNDKAERGGDDAVNALWGTYDNAAQLVRKTTRDKDGNKNYIWIHVNPNVAKGSADSLCRAYGKFIDKTEHTGKDGAPLIENRELITREMTPDQARAAFLKSRKR